MVEVSKKERVPDKVKQEKLLNMIRGIAGIRYVSWGAVDSYYDLLHIMNIPTKWLYD